MSQVGNKVLVIGDPQVGKKFIFQKLLNEEKLTLYRHQSATKSSTSPVIHEPYIIFPINNKYYSCDLHLYLIDNQSYQFDEDNLSEISHFLQHVCQGIILVYDEHRPQSFQSLDKWKHFVELIQPEVCLCIANNSSSSPLSSSATSLSSVRDWCIHNAIEFVSIDYVSSSAVTPSTSTSESTASSTSATTDAVTDTSSANKTDNNDEDDEYKEKEGFERIQEALECSIWRYMTRKKQSNYNTFNMDDNEGEEEDQDEINDTTSQQQDLLSSAAAAAETSTETAAQTSTETVAQTSTETAAQTSTISSSGSQKNDEDEQDNDEGLESIDDIDDANDDDDDIHNKDGEDDNHGNNDEDDEGAAIEADFESFDKLLSQIQQVRQMSTQLHAPLSSSSSSSATEEELLKKRRQEAERVMIMMVKMMGLTLDEEDLKEFDEEMHQYRGLDDK